METNGESAPFKEHVYTPGTLSFFSFCLPPAIVL